MKATRPAFIGPTSVPILFLASLLTLVAWSPAFADKGGDPPETKSGRLRSPVDVLKDLRESSRDVPSGAEDATPTLLPAVWCVDIDHELTRTVCWDAYRASLQYHASGLTHRTRVFWWQHLSTRIIFFVVLLLVASGMYFAWVQFRRDLEEPRPPGEGTSMTGHQVELSMTGIKVSSPVLGIIILALSLAFFYLYLVYVYPIAEIF